MKNTASLFRKILFLCWFVNAANVNAYNEAGHYYTLLALFDSSLTNTNLNKTDVSQIRLETFCAQLPDLAKELDAVTQRIRVLDSSRDLQWGLLGRCQSEVSSHMVASQYYLHGLSGAPAPNLRNAAFQIINNIDKELESSGLDDQKRRNLICARGFADHLYGDSFAHVKLKSEESETSKTEMYNTGIGHARDGHNPDYLHGHKLENDKWSNYVQLVGANIAKGANTNPIIESLTGCKENLSEACDKENRKNFEKLIRNNYIVNIQEIIDTDTTTFGERKTTCDEVAKKIFPNIKDRPQCNEVWNLYLDKAIHAFSEKDIDPTSRLNASANKNCSAWKCSDKDSYGGEPPSDSCVVDIQDKLKFGRNYK